MSAMMLIHHILESAQTTPGGVEPGSVHRGRRGNTREPGLRCFCPVLDTDRKPQGVVHAREIVLALLDEVTHEELLLRDYVLGIGYQ